jgi:hypothetical protein
MDLFGKWSVKTSTIHPHGRQPCFPRTGTRVAAVFILVLPPARRALLHEGPTKVADLYPKNERIVRGQRSTEASGMISNAVRDGAERIRKALHARASTS